MLNSPKTKRFAKQWGLIVRRFREIPPDVNDILHYINYLGSKNKLIARVLLLFDTQQVDEFQAILCGNFHYRNSLKERKNDYYLSRQLHRIEKALLLKNGKHEFGLSYILESMEIFEKYVNSADSRYYTPAIEYAIDVFEAYFKATKSQDPRYLKAQQIYANYLRLVDYHETSAKHTPYQREEFQLNNDIDMFARLLMKRKSVRHFRKVKPDKKVILKAIQHASYAPSGCNRQPFYFRVIDDESLLNDVRHLPPGGVGFADSIPMIVFVIADQSAFPQKSSSHEAYIDAALASMVFVLSLEIQGLSSCFMNWPHIHELNKKATSLMHLDKYQRIVTAIAVGYADFNENVAYSQRKEATRLTQFN